MIPLMRSSITRMGTSLFNAESALMSSNIDHRRVPNLMTLFERKAWSLPITKTSADYFPGDVVAWELDNKLLHIGIVTDAVAADPQNYLVVHNIGAGARIEDVLMAWKIIGHYRMWKQ